MSEAQSPRRAIIYTRLSQYKAVQKALGSIPHQEERCRKLAADRGWDVARVVHENEVSGDSASGWKPGARKGWPTVVADLRTGQADALVVVELSRMTRQMRELEDIIELAEYGTIEVASAQGDIDLGTTFGRMLARNLIAMSQAESEIKSERVKAARERQAGTGSYGGGIRPYGFRTTDKPGVLAEVPSEVAELDRMVADVTSGRTLWSIAHDLNERQVPTVKGGQWTPESVRSLILRERTAEIVSDRAVWQSAVEVLRNPARRVGPGSKARHLLSGILRCGVCGGPMSVQRCRGAYLCRRGGYTRIDQAKTDTEVIATIITRLAQPDAAALLARPYGTVSDLAALVTEAGKLRHRKAMLAGLFAAGEMDAQEWAAASKVVKDKLAALDAKLSAAAEHLADAPAATLAGREDAAQLWAALDLESKRAVIRSLVTIEIKRQGRGRLPDGSYTRWNPQRITISWRGEAVSAGEPAQAVVAAVA